MMHVVSYFLGILLQLFFLATDVKAVGCPPSEYYTVPSFGSNCEYRCRCVNDTQCDNSTGECAEGCALGWMGPACQYRNVSPLYKAVTQSATLSSAQDAVDGNVATCSDTGVTNHGSPHWWRIEFHRNFYVVGLKITVPGDNTETFRKFQVKSESSDGTSEHDCYQYPDMAGSRIMEVICRQPVNTSRLMIQLDRTGVALKLCEVEIYGGRLVSFNRITSSDSETHDNPISENYKWSKEHAVDGLPLWNTTTGPNEAKTCFASGGSTSSGDIYWWQVDLGTTYTVQDVNVFSRWHIHAIFIQTQGYTITLGTSTGQFTSVFYDDPPVGYTPDFYQPRHSNLAIQMEADKVKLTRQKVPGVDRFVLCEVEVFAECPEDTCGWNCSIPCYCNDITTGTFKIDGTCPYGCKPGWKGDVNRCDTLCGPGHYGVNCLEQCGYCLEGRVCDRLTGYCTGDCQAGYHGDRCDTECQDGRYGINCNNNCSGNCRGHQPCDKKTGSCPGGCERGWHGSLCTQPCMDQTHGYNCSETCGYCSGNATCDGQTGACPYGCCQTGYVGLLCKAAASTSNDNPSNNTGTITWVVIGIAIALIVINNAAWFLYIKRRKQNIRDENQKLAVAVNDIANTDVNHAPSYINMPYLDNLGQRPKAEHQIGTRHPPSESNNNPYMDLTPVPGRDDHDYGTARTAPETSGSPYESITAVPARN